jgi:hypothetical protein
VRDRAAPSPISTAVPGLDHHLPGGLGGPIFEGDGGRGRVAARACGLPGSLPSYRTWLAGGRCGGDGVLTGLGSSDMPGGPCGGFAPGHDPGGGADGRA